MSSLYEREYLLRDAPCRWSGFTPRPVEKLAVKKLPKSDVHIQCNHILRTGREVSASNHRHPSAELQLWREVGRHSPLYPDEERFDFSYNSNIWRNFTQKNSGDGLQESKPASSQHRAVRIPSPSRLGENSYVRFVRESVLIKDSKQRDFIVQQTMKELEEMRQNQLKSDARNPPVDKSGKWLLSAAGRSVEGASAIAFCASTPTTRESELTRPIVAEVFPHQLWIKISNCDWILICQLTRSHNTCRGLFFRENSSTSEFQTAQKLAASARHARLPSANPTRANQDGHVRATRAPVQETSALDTVQQMDSLTVLVLSSRRPVLRDKTRRVA